MSDFGSKEIVEEWSGREVRTTSSSGGEKGVKEARYDLIPVEPLRWLAEVYGYGVNKYPHSAGTYQGPNEANWTRGYEWSKNFGAMQRHIEAARGGEWFDPESGKPHLAHAAWHCFTLMWFFDYRPQFDDRLVEPGVPSTLDEAFARAWAETEGGR